MKKYILFAILFLLIIAVVVYKITEGSKTKYYGNNEEMIGKVIHSIDGYENQTITVLEIKDFNEIRIAGILADNRASY